MKACNFLLRALVGKKPAYATTAGSLSVIKHVEDKADELDLELASRGLPKRRGHYTITALDQGDGGHAIATLTCDCGSVKAIRVSELRRHKNWYGCSSKCPYTSGRRKR